MKKIILSLAVLASVALVSCGNGAKTGDSNDSPATEQGCPKNDENNGEEAPKVDEEKPEVKETTPNPEEVTTPNPEEVTTPTPEAGK